MTRFDDEKLMAYADGQLDAATSANIERVLAEDADIANRLAAFEKSRDLVRDLFAPLVAAPVPASLVASVTALAGSDAKPEAANVIRLPRARQLPMASLLPMALAAGLAALIAGPVGFYVGGATGDREGLRVDGDLPASVALALDTAASGSELPIAELGRLRMIATFQDASGGLCREFEVDGNGALVAVACRSGEGWRIAFAVEAPLSGEGYAPASSLAALDAYLAAISAGEPMSPAREAEALRVTE